MPWIVAGAGIALRTIGLRAERRRSAVPAIVIGASTLILCGIGTDWSSES